MDMRCGFPSLALRVQEVLKLNLRQAEKDAAQIAA
jgi:hypothetical protein